MIEYADINKYLQDKKVLENTISNNQNELLLAKEMILFTERSILKNFSNIKNKDHKEALINKTLLLLFAQGYKSYKGCLSLILNGYYTDVIILMRNLIETIFNIKYILDEEAETYNKADQYTNNFKKWTNETIKSRAYISSNSTLYSLYGMSSDFTHSNYIATSQNCNKDGVLILSSSEIGIKKGFNLINSVYYFLLEFMAMHYEISFSSLDDLEKNDEFMKYYKTYYMYNFQKRRY